MHTRLFLSAFATLLAAAVLWVGCDSAGTTGSDPSVPSVQFASAGAGGVPTDSIVDIGVTLTDSVGAEVSVEVLFAAAASSAAPSDVGNFGGEASSEAVTFPASAGVMDTQTVKVDISNADLSEGSKDAFFALQGLQSEGTVEIGTPREFGLSIGAKPIAEARAEGRDALANDDQVTVTIQGTVSRATSGGYARIQDESGPTGASGIMIRQVSGDLSSDFQADVSDGTIQPGTELLLTGAISQFSGLLQINGDDLDSYDVISQGDPPEPQTVSLSDLEGPAGENYESELLRIEGLSFPNASGTFDNGVTYDVQDETGTTFMFRTQDSDETNIGGEPIPEGTFTYEGVLGQFNNFSGATADEGYQLIPMQPSDVQPAQ